MSVDRINDRECGEIETVNIYRESVCVEREREIER